MKIKAEIDYFIEAFDKYIRAGDQVTLPFSAFERLMEQYEIDPVLSFDDQVTALEEEIHAKIEQEGHLIHIRHVWF